MAIAPILLQQLENPDIQMTDLDLRQNSLTDADVALLAQGLPGKNRLRSLHLGQNSFGDAGAIDLAKGIAGNDSLKVIYMDDNTIGDAGALALAEALRGKHNVTTFTMDRNRMSAVGHTALAGVLAQNPNLRFFNAGFNKPGHGGDISVALPFFRAGHKSLITAGTGHPALQAMADHNKAYAQALVHSFESNQPIPARELCDASIRMDAIDAVLSQRTGSVTARKQVEAAMDLPEVSIDTIENFSDLTTTIHDGRAALDIPSTWLKFPEIAAKLAAKGMALTKSQLLEVNQDGDSYLSNGIRAGCGAQIIDLLQAQHEPILPEELLDDAGKPTALLQAAIDARDVAPLFLAENWAGASVRDLRRVYHALPEPEQAQVPLQRLTAELKRAEHLEARFR